VWALKATKNIAQLVKILTYLKLTKNTSKMCQSERDLSTKDFKSPDNIRTYTRYIDLVCPTEFLTHKFPDIKRKTVSKFCVMTYSFIRHELVRILQHNYKNHYVIILLLLLITILLHTLFLMKLYLFFV